MTRWRSLSRPKFNGLISGRTLVISIAGVRPLPYVMLYAYNRPSRTPSMRWMLSRRHRNPSSDLL